MRGRRNYGLEVVTLPHTVAQYHRASAFYLKTRDVAQVVIVGLCAVKSILVHKT